MIKRFIILCLTFLPFIVNIKAQDIHFTQFESASMSINPALTGLFEGSHRFAMNNRMQWRSVTVPYLTVAASVDMPVVIREYNRDIIGMGLSAYRDVSGDSHFGTTQFNYSLSYIKGVDRKNANFLSGGLNLGIAQRSISYNDLKFDSQFNGYKYDPSLSNMEGMNTENYFFADLGLGVNWRYQPITHKVLNTGISLSHVNRPGQSLTNDNKIKLDPKLSIYSFGLIEAVSGIDLLPKIIFQKQGPYREIVWGLSSKFIRKPKPSEYLAIHTGFYVRNKDAVAIQSAIEMKSTYISLSYDVNFSGLTPASTAMGGFELAIIYKISKQKTVRTKALSCPIF